MTDEPLVSIVTVSFNQGRYLPQCISSVAKQSYRKIEHIVVDAGSTDGSRDVIRANAGSIASAILEPDNGAPDGLNKGFRRARGDILTYLNSDDVLYPDAVALAVDILHRNPSVDVVFGDADLVDQDGRFLRRIFSDDFRLPAFSLGACTVVQQGTFFRRPCFERTGGFRTELATGWDLDLLCRMAISGARFRRMNRVMGQFRFHPESIGGTGRPATWGTRRGPDLFRMVHGRSARPADRLTRVGHLVVKYVARPESLLERLRRGSMRRFRYARQP